MLSNKERQERRQRITTLWRAGVKSEAICAEIGIDYNQLRKYRRMLGLPPRRTGHNKPIVIPTLNEHQLLHAQSLWRQKMDTMKIARRIGKEEAAVYNSLANARAGRGQHGKDISQPVDCGARGTTEEAAC